MVLKPLMTHENVGQAASIVNGGLCEVVLDITEFKQAILFKDKMARNEEHSHFARNIIGCNEVTFKCVCRDECTEQVLFA